MIHLRVEPIQPGADCSQLLERLKRRRHPAPSYEALDHLDFTYPEGHAYGVDGARQELRLDLDAIDPSWEERLKITVVT